VCVCVKEKCFIHYLSKYSLVIIFPIIGYLNMRCLNMFIFIDIKSHVLFNTRHKESNLYYTIILLVLIKYIILFINIRPITHYPLSSVSKPCSWRHINSS